MYHTELGERIEYMICITQRIRYVRINKSILHKFIVCVCVFNFIFVGLQKFQNDVPSY